MNRYQNFYMGFSIEFPDAWNCRCWENRKRALQNPLLHQASYDDLPSKKSPHKILLTSFRRFDSNPSILDGVLELVALYRPNGIDLASEIPVNSSEISREYGEYNLADNNSIFLHLEAQGKKGIRYTRYYFWSFQKKVWLSCVISGASQEKFNEALSILRSIKKL